MAEVTVMKLDQWGHEAGEEVLTDFLMDDRVDWGELVEKHDGLFGKINLVWDWFYLNEKDYAAVEAAWGDRYDSDSSDTTDGS